LLVTRAQALDRTLTGAATTPMCARKTGWLAGFSGIVFAIVITDQETESRQCKIEATTMEVSNMSI
jgi:hypothetical protein